MTPTELKTRALQEIRVVEKTQSPPAEEFAIAGQRYAALHAMLLERNLATWSLTEDIPDKCALPLIWMLGNLLTGILGCPDEIRTEFYTLGAFDSRPVSLGERQLRAVLARDYVAQSATPDYF